MADLIVLEEWRKCPGFPNYSVSNYGRVRRDVSRTCGKAGRILPGRFNEKGYRRIKLCRDGGEFERFVHRLVALAFLGEQPKGKPWVNHLNAVPGDDRLENLEWASPKDDAAHRDKMGHTARGDSHYSRTRPELLARGDRNGARTHPEKVNRGERVGGAKLTEDRVREARFRAANGEDQRAIAADLGVTQAAISLIVRRKTWRHVA